MLERPLAQGDTLEIETRFTVRAWPGHGADRHSAPDTATITVRAVGPDERDALEAIRDLVDGKFGGEP